MTKEDLREVVMWQRREKEKLGRAILELVKAFEDSTDLSVVDMEIFPDDYGPRADKTSFISIEVALR